MLNKLPLGVVCILMVIVGITTVLLVDAFIRHKYIEANAALAVELTELGYKPMLINNRCLVPVEGYWMVCNDAVVYNRLTAITK